MDHKCQSASTQTFRPDRSLMGRYNVLGNGQPQAVAACLDAAGLVCAVKAVKEMGKLVLLNGLGGGVGPRKDNGSSQLFQTRRHLSAGGPGGRCGRSTGFLRIPSPPDRHKHW